MGSCRGGADWFSPTSAKRLKEYSLLNAGLRLNAFVKNAVAFFKLI